METRLKQQEVQKVKMRTVYVGNVSVDCTGNGKDRTGGLLLMWKEKLDVRITSYSSNHISGVVADNMDTQGWAFNEIYGYPNEQNKKHTRSLFKTLQGVQEKDQSILEISTT